MGSHQFLATIRTGAPSAPGSPQTFTFASNGDTNDMFYFIGRAYGTASWANPEPGTVTVTRKSSLNGSDADLTNRTAEYNTTDNSSAEFVAVDIGTGNAMVVSDYSLRDGGNGGGAFLRNWKLQGSNNVATNDVTGIEAATWVDLDIRATNTTINTTNGWGHFICTEGVPTPYRWLRIKNTGIDAIGLQFIQLCEFQFYGEFTF